VNGSKPVRALALHAIQHAPTTDILDDVQEIVESLWDSLEPDDFDDTDAAACLEDIRKRRKVLA
jgi:hypothetical protein